MKRILFVGHSALQGGAEFCLNTTLEHLDRRGRELHAVFPAEGPMTQAARTMGIPVEIVPLNWWMYWPPSAWYYKSLLVQTLPNIHRLLGIMRRRRIDVVYSNSVAIFEPALAARIAGIPHIWHCHEVLGTSALSLRLYKKLIDSLSARIVFESNSSKAAFEDGKESSKSRVVYNSVRFAEERHGSDRDAARASVGAQPGDLLVAFVGQLIERKNPLLLLHAAKLLSDLPNVKFLVVGDGPLLPDVTAAIRSLGLEGRVQVLNFQENVAWVFDALDVLVLPSREESFGLVLVEAGSFGKPAIATRVEGPAEIVVDGETGFLTDKDDEAALAERIRYFSQNPSRQTTMGQAAQRRVNEMFSAATTTRRVAAIIDEVLQPNTSVIGSAAAELAAIN